MGQEKAVRVVRFCVRGLEEELYNAIDFAAAKLVTRQNDNNYMCESAHKSLDKELLQKKKAADDDDVCMMESVSAKERVARQRAQAVANNEVIVIDDSDDEEEEDSKPKALPTVKAPVAANTKVKSEPTFAAKRTNEEIGDKESSSARYGTSCIQWRTSYNKLQL